MPHSTRIKLSNTPIIVILLSLAIGCSENNKPLLNLTILDKSAICRTYVGALMGYSPSSFLTVSTKENGAVVITTKGNLYSCLIHTNSVVWQTHFDTSGWGRLREEDVADLTFNHKAGTVRISSTEIGSLHINLSPQEVTPPLITKPTSSNQLFTDKQICVAAISVEFSAPPDSISSSTYGADAFHISYHQASDGEYRGYYCKVNDSRVVWATPGERWRDNYEHDTELRYSVDTNDRLLTIIQKLPEGSESNVSFNPRQLTSK